MNVLQSVPDFNHKNIKQMFFSQQYEILLFKDIYNVNHEYG